MHHVSSTRSLLGLFFFSLVYLVILIRAAISYDKDIFDIVARVQVNQIYANKGVPIGVLLSCLGMTNWDIAVDTIAAYAQVEVSVVAKLLRACESDATQELDTSVSKFDASWSWIADKVSAKQRTRTYDPLPQHPPESKRNAAQEVIHHHVSPASRA